MILPAATCIVFVRSRRPETHALLRKEHLTAQEVNLAETKIVVSNNGPLRIEGDFAIYDIVGKAFGLGGRTAVSLCRCGNSQNKPFCDGSHKRVNFQSEVKARDLPPPLPKPPAA
jgi:CDGSH-type Zn-finger protein